MKKIKKLGAAIMCLSVFFGMYSGSYADASEITEVTTELNGNVPEIDEELSEEDSQDNTEIASGGKTEGDIPDTGVSEEEPIISDEETEIFENKDGDKIEETKGNEDESINESEIKSESEEEDGVDALILEDMDEGISAYAETGDYEAEYRWHYPGEEEEHVEYGTFEEMWKRMREEKVGRVKLLKDVTATYEFTLPNGMIHHGFGNGDGFDDWGGLVFLAPPTKWLNEEDYEWPALDLNFHTLDGNNSAEVAQAGYQHAMIQMYAGNWGNIYNGTIKGSNGAAIYVTNGLEPESELVTRLVISNITLTDNHAFRHGTFTIRGTGQILVSIINLTIKNNYRYNGLGAGIDSIKGFGLTGYVDIYDNYTMTNGEAEQSNIYLNSETEVIDLNTDGPNIQGKIGVSTSAPAGSEFIKIDLDNYDAGNIVVDSDDINYLVMPSTDNGLVWTRNTLEEASEAVYYEGVYGEMTGTPFYGTAEEVWNYACEKGTGTVYLRRNISRKISDKPEAPDFPVFGWGENFTEDGAFLLKSTLGAERKIYIGCYDKTKRATINGMYSGSAPDENGIGHVFVLEGTDDIKEAIVLYIRNLNIKNTGNSAVYVKSGLYSRFNSWDCDFNNCYAERGGAIRLEGGYTDLGDTKISDCYCTDVGGAIYSNTKYKVLKKNIIYSSDCGREWYNKDENYSAYGFAVGNPKFRALNNYKILEDGTTVPSNIYLASGNEVTLAYRTDKVNVSDSNIFGLDAEDGLFVNVINNSGNNNMQAVPDNPNYKCVSNKNFSYITRMFIQNAEAYGSTKGWDTWENPGTFEEIWNWAAEQDSQVWVQVADTITAKVRDEEGYPDYPVFGMGPGFSDTGEVVVNNGQHITLHCAHHAMNRSMESYNAIENGYGAIVIKDGGILRLEGNADRGMQIINCASSAIRVENGGLLFANNVRLYKNKAVKGAGIWNQGTVKVKYTDTYNVDGSLIIYDNTATEAGGGIWNDGVIEIQNVGRHAVIGNTSDRGSRLRQDDIFLTANGSIIATENVGDEYTHQYQPPYAVKMGIRSEIADRNEPAVAIKDYFAVPSKGKTVEETLFSDNVLLSGFKQDGNDLVFNLEKETKQLTDMEVSCLVFDGSSWFETAKITDGIWKAEFDKDDGYLYYVEIDEVDKVFKEWGFDASAYKGKEIGFGTREENGTDTITNNIKPITKDGKVYVPAGIVDEYNYGNNLKLYFTSSGKEYNHKEINYANLNEFRPDGRVQISIIDRKNNIKRESFGLDQPYETTVDWLDGYEWFVYYLNGLPFNDSLLTKTYDGFKLNINMKSVPYPLMIRESEAKRVFNVILKANVDGEIRNFDRLPEILGPKLYDGQAQFYISSKVFDEYLSAFGFDSSTYKGEKIFGYKLKGSDEIVPLDIRKGESGDWEFLLPNPSNDPYGFDDGELYLFSRETDEIHHVGDEFPEDISFYSVRIDDILGRNDWHYTDLSTTYYVASNDPFHISLPARSAGSWTCSVDADIRTAAGGMYMTISIPKVTQPTVLTCGENGGMEFTVQYYGALEQLDYTDPGDAAYDNFLTNKYNTYRWDDRMIKGIIDVINTSGAVLPDNTWSHKTAKTRQISVIKSGNDAGKFESHTELLPLNKQKEFLYEATPSLATVLRTYRGSHYEITELWVLKNEDDLRKEWEEQHPEPEEPDPDNPDTGEEPTEPAVPDFTPASPDSTNRDDWTIYTKADLGVEDFSHVKLMNIPTEGHNGALQIREGDVLRFIYTPVESIHEADVRFYDYDVSDGYWYSTKQDAQNGTNRNPMSTYPYATQENTFLKVNMQGINSPINHQNSIKPRYSFGNGSQNTGNEDAQLDNIYNINQANIQANNKYGVARQCCFGIAQGLDTNNNIIYNEQISVPSLFDEDTSISVIGKTTLVDYKLQFNRTGDVFTLTGVHDGDNNQVLSNLDRFFQPRSFTHIWTNNFYPLDTYVQNNPDGHDPLYGATGKIPNHEGTKNNGKLFESDDGQNHNHFFGMHYEIRFRMPADYIGPMEYVFFGDDDLWIFLDGQKVMDIGGVHASAGQYLNLWDYIEQGDTSEHKLSVFYTERGASGSTCFMRFIIPNARFMDMGLSNLTGAIYLEKSAVAARDTNKDYKFHISLKDENGNPYVYETLDGSDASQGQPYIIYDSKNNVKTTGFITGGELDFTLKDMESMLIPGVKRGTQYQIDEEPELDMDTWVQKYGTESLRQHWIKGTVTGMSVEEVLYTNTWEESYEETEKLPDAGGTPYYGWIIGLGVLLIGSYVFVKYNKQR